MLTRKTEALEKIFESASLKYEHSFWQVALNILSLQLQQADLTQRLVGAVLQLIQSEREGARESQVETISKLVHILMAVDLYKHHFEPQLLAATSDFYNSVSLQNEFEK